MKKLITVLLIVALFMTGGCAKIEQVVSGKGYTILEVGGDDSFVSGANHASEISLNRTRTVEFKANKEKEICYRGTNYQVTYEETIRDPYYNGEVERYAKYDGLNGVEFEVNTKTGRLDSYSWYDEDYLNNPNLEKKSKEECLDIAREYLALYIDDSEEYEVVEEDYYESPTFEAIYDFLLVRMIDGVRAGDSARIQMTVHGIVIYHGFLCLGEMRDAQLPDEDTMAAIQEDNRIKLDGIYEPVKEKYEVSYELNQLKFMRLEDGRYALEYKYKVIFREWTEEEPELLSGHTRLIVILEDY